MYNIEKLWKYSNITEHKWLDYISAAQNEKNANFENFKSSFHRNSSMHMQDSGQKLITPLFVNLNNWNLVDE